MTSDQPTRSPKADTPEPAPGPALQAARDLIRIDNEVLIDADLSTVYAYVTNASRWHEWHPATRSVEALPDRPLLLGEQVVEHIRAGGRRFTAVWTVLDEEAPIRWVIGTDTPEGLARITYALADVASSDQRARTRFQRTLVCRSKGWLRWLDRVIIPLTLVPQSRRALDNLKARIEEKRKS